MEIKNEYSPVFNAIYVKTSNMNKAQAQLGRKIAKLVKQTDSYSKIADSVDLYILPAKSENSIFVRFFDVANKMLFRKDEQPIQKRINLGNKSYVKNVDGICDVLDDIHSGKIKKNEVNETNIIRSIFDSINLG